MNRAVTRTLCAGLMLAAQAIAIVPAAAQLPAPARIGIVNPDRILNESAPARRAQERLKAEFGKHEAELARMAGEAQRLQADLEKNGLTMAATERTRKERSLGELGQAFERRKRSVEEEFEQRRNESMQAISAQADQVIRTVAQREKLDLVVRDAVFASPKIDITDKVIEALATTK